MYKIIPVLLIIFSCNLICLSQNSPSFEEDEKTQTTVANEGSNKSYKKAMNSNTKTAILKI